MTTGSLFTHSRDRSPDPSDLMCISTSSCACWCPNSRSAKVRLKRSTTPWSLWMSTRPRLTETPCFARSWPAAPINSRPGSTWRSLGHFRGPRLQMRDRASATSAAVLLVRGSASLKRLATSTTVRAYLYTFLPPGKAVMGKKQQVRLVDLVWRADIKPWSGDPSWSR